MILPFSLDLYFVIIYVSSYPRLIIKETHQILDTYVEGDKGLLDDCGRSDKL